MIINPYGLPQNNMNKMQIQPVNYFDPSKYTQQDQIQPKPVGYLGGPQIQPMPPQPMTPPRLMGDMGGGYTEKPIQPIGPPQPMIQPVPQMQPPSLYLTSANAQPQPWQIPNYNPTPIAPDNSGLNNGGYGGYPNNDYKRFLLQQLAAMGVTPGVQMY